jgi:hypothetical protein
MKNKIPIHTRYKFYHLPIYCGFCGQLVTPKEEDLGESVINPCKHTLFIAHSEGYEFLSDRAQEQLVSKNFVVERDDSWIEVTKITGEDEEFVSIHEILEEFDLPDVLVVESVVGPPSGMSFMVGFAPTEDE